jgi:dTDP-4-amino-4,6-dideoxygalactose transaminase
LPDGPAWLTVTSPRLPDFDALAPLLKDVLDRRWVTNQGHYARLLEQRLAAHLGVAELLIAGNGTVAIEMAVAEAIPPGEVICTAYSFPATWNLLFENPRWTPVMVDIDPSTFCVDPAAVAAAITPRTSGIIAVHPYGIPCDNTALRSLADRHGLGLVYDAAHAFGVRQDGVPLGAWGDLSTFSFHATKVYSTLEGGALTGRPDLLARVDRRRNFGISRDHQVQFGTNGKIDEFRAVVGLLNLDRVDAAIAHRAGIAAAWRERLGQAGLAGLQFVDAMWRPGVSPNYGYFPVRITPESPVDRDAAFHGLVAQGVLARRYFYPTAATAPLYADRVDQAALPQAAAASREVLCLPIHHQMTEADVDHVVGLLRRLWGAR